MSRQALQSVFAGMLVLLALVVGYWPSLSGDFLWDDDAYVVHNETLKDARGLKQIWLEPGRTPQYYPLVFTTFWIETRLFGQRPVAFRVTNLALHALAAFLLYRLLRTLGVPGAGLAGALFALHPVMLESVAWITERKNCLSLVLYLGSFLAWLRCAGSRWRWYAASLCLFVLALWSKTVTASLPAAVLLAAWWKEGRIDRRDLLRLAPYFAIGIGMGLHTAWLEQHHVGARGDEWSLSAAERLLVAGRVPWFYAWKLLLPYPLSFVYARWTIDTAAAWQWIFPLGTIAVLAALVLLRGRVGRGAAAATLFFVGTLFPALGLINVFPMRYSFVADHFQYHASLGLLALGAAGIARLPRPRVVGVAAAVILALLLRARAPVYGDLDALWTDTLRKNPSAWMAHHNLGLRHFDRGEDPQAIASYEAALSIRPDLAYTHFCLGNALARQRRYEDAQRHLEEALRLDPTLAGARSNLANVLERLGRRTDAIGEYRRVLAEHPGDAAAQRNLAFLLAAEGDVAAALAAYKESLRLEPGDAGAAMRYAWLLATAGAPEHRDGAEAVRWAEAALRASPRPDPQVLQVAAAAYAEAGQYERAVETIERAIDLVRAGGRADRLAPLLSFREQFQAGRAYHTQADP